MPRTCRESVSTATTSTASTATTMPAAMVPQKARLATPGAMNTPVEKMVQAAHSIAAATRVMPIHGSLVPRTGRSRNPPPTVANTSVASRPRSCGARAGSSPTRPSWRTTHSAARNSVPKRTATHAA